MTRTLKTVTAAGAACAMMALASCGGGGEAASESSTAAEFSESVGGNATAELVNRRRTPMEIDEFRLVTNLLDNEGIDYSDVEDTTDDDFWAADTSGNLVIDGLGKAYFSSSENPQGYVARALGLVEGDSDIAYGIVGASWYLEIYDGDVAVAERVADALWGSLYAFDVR